MPSLVAGPETKQCPSALTKLIGILFFMLVYLLSGYSQTNNSQEENRLVTFGKKLLPKSPPGSCGFIAYENVKHYGGSASFFRAVDPPQGCGSYCLLTVQPKRALRNQTL